jgi:DNA replication protein DnaC
LKWVDGGNGWKRCECFIREQREKKLAQIPPEYQEITLETMRPDARRHPKQAILIPRLQKEPRRSVIMTGPHGTGKTAIAYALYRRAVEDDRPAVFCYLPDLLADLREAELRDDYIPCISVDALTSEAKGAPRWLIVIDDFNVGRPSNFAGEMLASILNAIYNYHHQLVITAHCSIEELKQHWERAGAGYGGSIIRRSVQSHDALFVNFFDGVA